MVNKWHGRIDRRASEIERQREEERIHKTTTIPPLYSEKNSLKVLLFLQQ